MADIRRRVYVVGEVGGAGSTDGSKAWIFGLHLLMTNTASLIATATTPSINMYHQLMSKPCYWQRKKDYEHAT